MPHPLSIEKVHIRNFGCVQHVDLKLAPMHALIGPNDSGKSTILRAVRTAMQLINGSFTGSLTDTVRACQPFDPGSHQNARIVVFLRDYLKYTVQINDRENLEEAISLGPGKSQRLERTIWREPSERRQFLATTDPSLTREDYLNAGLPENFGPRHPEWSIPSKRNKYNKLMKRARPGFPFGALSQREPRMVRIDPDSLREPAGLIPSSQPISLPEKGIGLVAALDALMNRNLDGYLEIRKRVVQLFPTIASIGMKNVETETNSVLKMLEFELKDGTRVPAQFMSEGVLYYLAFAALQYLEPPSLLLVEEPENGLHPARIRDIMHVLREVSKTTQVIIGTHSPLIINEMKPEEVTVVWRHVEEGTSVTPIEETKNFEERAAAYALGELWLSYADGIDEAELRGRK